MKITLINIWAAHNIGDAAEHINTERFRKGPLPSKRENLVAYSGRLSKVKGLSNLVKAVPLVVRQKIDAKFIIAGNGEKWSTIGKEIEELEVKSLVVLRSWVSDEEFPQFLSQIKLFVLPSYEEGIPSVIREAMACGAIVLTTPVGAIPDIIRDGDTGFIMVNNTPECIANNIQRVLECSYLDKIAQNARAQIERESSFETVIRKWRGILEEINN